MKTRKHATKKPIGKNNSKNKSFEHKGCFGECKFTKTKKQAQSIFSKVRKVFS